MKQKELSIALKAIVALCGLILAVVAGVLLPTCGFDLLARFPSETGLIWSALIFLWITSIPVVIVLVLVWQISTQIGRNNSFSMENARNLKSICILSMTDTLLYFCASVLLLLFHRTFPLLLTILVLCIGVAISVVSAVFSHLVQKGAEMKAEQDLTI